jgi:hypothetical protein
MTPQILEPAYGTHAGGQYCVVEANTTAAAAANKRVVAEPEAAGTLDAAAN